MDHQKDNTPRPPTQSDKGQKSPHQGGAFIVRKAEKLTTALYMVTDIMSDKEPMKWKARETVVELLTDITMSMSAPASERMSILRTVLRKIDHVITFLDIAQTTRMMSAMNASVLKREYVALRETIDAEWKQVYESGKAMFTDTFFDVPVAPLRVLESGKQEIVREEQALRVEERAKGQSNAPKNTQGQNTPPSKQHEAGKTSFIATPRPPQRIPVVFENTPKPVAPVAPSIPPSPIVSTPRIHTERLPASAPARVAANTPDLTLRTRPDADRGDRRSIILALIKEKPSLNVRDLVDNIPNVSEKTLQRELIAMVADGILVKRGERRWSTYSLR